MRRLSREVAAKLSIVLKCVLTFKQHFELGRRPRQPAYPGKVDRESECGSFWSNQAGSVGPPDRRAFLFSDSIIDPATIQAYLETHYRVRGEAPFVLQIGQVSPDLLSLYRRHNVDCAAFLTGWNPFSREVSEAENRDRQKALAAELTRRSLAFLEGIGQHPSNNWPGEESLLVLGLSLEAAKTLGERFEQNAIVWCGADGVPQLIVLR